MSAVPADADPLARGPSLHTCSDRVNYTRDLMSWYSRVLNTRPQTQFGKRVAVANTARLNFDPHFFRSGRRDFALHEFKCCAWTSDLDGTHLHTVLPSIAQRRTAHLASFAPTAEMHLTLR